MAALSLARRALILGRSGRGRAVLVACLVLFGSVQVASHASAGTTTGADLQISGSASSGSQAPGAAFTYTYKVKNSGPQTATAATLTDAPFITSFATRVNITSATVNGNSAACSGATDSTGSVTLTCNLGDMASGSQLTVVENATAPTVNGTYYDEPEVLSAVTDPNMVSNFAEVAIKVSGTTPLVNTPCATMTVPSPLSASFTSSTNQAVTQTVTMSATVKSCSALTQPNLMVNFVGGPTTQPDAAIFTCQAPVPTNGVFVSFALAPGATLGVTCQTTTTGAPSDGGVGTATLYADCQSTGVLGPMSVSNEPNPCTDVLATATYDWGVTGGIVPSGQVPPPFGHGGN
jgi:uncharacterized repeat protein (TIGR01451 family)